ncbi:uncharacterized protein G2W53_030373 [Senna tora]|uniref:Uncharacterized protein n=1 Tax=Senna tora TaxID=362788 RepID=A0A834TFJ2_9FABA|nr:uncharacterized protein G2W53_030373 [Senna tora]
MALTKFEDFACKNAFQIHSLCPYTKLCSLLISSTRKHG